MGCGKQRIIATLILGIKAGCSQVGSFQGGDSARQIFESVREEFNVCSDGKVVW